MLRALFLTLLTIVVLLVAAVVVAPMLIPSDTVRSVVSTQGAEVLGRDVAIDGDIKITVLPRVGATIQGVRVANAEGFGDEPFAELEELKVGVALAPLIGRKVEVQELVLVRPQVRLQAKADGANNWTFEPAAETAAAPPRKSYGAAAPFKRAPGSLPLKVALGDVRVVDGAATYQDAATGAAHAVTDLDLSVNMPALDAPFRLDGSFNLDDAPMGLAVTLDTLQRFFDGDETPAEIRLDSELLAFAAEGAFAESEDPAFAGDVTLTVPSLRQLAALAKAELPPSGVDGRATFERLEIAGRAVFANEEAAFEDATLEFDDMRGEGDLRIDLSGAIPSVVGRLDLNALDVTPYAPAAPADAPADTGGDGADADAIPPWTEDPIDLTALALADVDFDLTVDGLRFGDIAFGAGAVTLDIADGRMTAALEKLEAYEGVASGAVTATGVGAPRLGIDFTLDGVQGGPLLADAAGFDRVEGRADMRLAVSGDARSMAALMNSLAGDGSFGFTDGEVRGVNLDETAKAIEDVLDGRLPSLRGFGQRQTTDFAELTGSFTVANGVATTTDLSLTNPVVVMAGGGTVNLGGQSVDLLLEPRLVAAPRNDLADIPVPVRISGPWSDVSTGIDRERVQGLAGGFVRQEIDDLIDEQLGDRLTDELGDELGDAATDALKSIFGGGKRD